LIGTLLSKSNDARTPTQTLAGIYWGYDGVPNLGTPPRLYNQIIRVVAMNRKKPNTVGDNARLFAFVNAAMGDAGILAWDQKYIHNFWRPVVAIREHDRSMGPQGDQPANELVENCDPLWLPLGAQSTNKPSAKNFTPPFPAYPSGHATFGAAAFHITRLFYETGGRFDNNSLTGDDLFKGLDFVSEEFNGRNTDNRGTIRPRHRRSFARGLFDMLIENGISRVLLGVHWVFDAFAVKGPKRQPDLTKKVGKRFIGGVPLGLIIAEDIYGAKRRAPEKSTVGPRT
jgi:vanadium chloroperoxidase